MALHVDLGQLTVRHGGHDPPRGGGLSAPPPGELLAIGRAVRPQVPAEDPPHGVLTVRDLPTLQPSVGADEGHALPLRRTGDQRPLERRRLEHLSPSGQHPIPSLGPDLRGHLVRQLLSRQRASSHGVPDRVEGRSELVGAHPYHPEPRALPPPIVRAERGRVHRPVLRRVEVERPPLSPRSDQRAPLPQGIADVLRPHAFDPSPHLKLGRGLDLRVNPAHSGHDVEEPPLRHPPIEVLANHAPPSDLLPGQPGHPDGSTSRCAAWAGWPRTR
jgi:hypothetical protein